MGRPLPGRSSADDQEVLLGMPGAWADENDELSDHYTTKIGGQPDWPASIKPLIKGEQLKCSTCDGYLGLVAQVHAPLASGGLYFSERTLYILGCPAQGCGIGPTSWRTIRVQKNTVEEPAPGVGNDSEIQYVDESSAESAPDPISEWGGPSSRQDGVEGTQREDWWDDNLWDGVPAEESSYSEPDSMNFHELQSSLTEAAQLAATVLGSQSSDASRRSALQSNTDTRTGRGPNQNLPLLPCFYIYTQAESSSEVGASASTTNSQEALQPAGENEYSNNGAEEPGEIWGSEEYEHDQAVYADRTYLKFKKKLDLFPEQCFRYSFGGEPLWAIDEHRDAANCAACGGPRVFEMQLMPPLLYYLQQAHKDLLPSLYGPDDWDWDTLIVFSCAQSCVQEEADQLLILGEKTDWSFAEEVTILQQDLSAAFISQISARS